MLLSTVASEPVPGLGGVNLAGALAVLCLLSVRSQSEFSA